MMLDRLSDLMAAEITGLDLRKPLSTRMRDEIHEAFLEHQVLVFRGQCLGKAEQIRFSQSFGELERHAKRNTGTEDFPLLHVVNNLDRMGQPSKLRSQRWHSDKSFRPAPSSATLLHAIELPPAGGDTCFASMYAAYDALPETRKQALEGLRIVHSWEHSRDNVGVTLSAEEIADAPPMSHPLVRYHPDTGRPALFLGIHAAYIESMPFEAGQQLILDLEAHATTDAFVYRHVWQPGDLLMWDNRCLLHRADANFETSRHRRVMHRTCLRGTPTAGQCVAKPPWH
jgi:taurine dioxygenase